MNARGGRSVGGSAGKRAGLGMLQVVVLLAVIGCSTAPERPLAGAVETTREEPPQNPPSSTGGPAVPVTPEYVTFDFKDADLHQVLQALSRQVGVNILADPEVRERVTAHMDRVPWRHALDVISRQAKCRIVEESGRLIRLTQPPSITMEFQDADIRAILTLLAKQAGVNIVFGSDIQGKVTLSLRDVPWMDALEAVVKTSGYIVVHEGTGPSPTSLRVMRP